MNDSTTRKTLSLKKKAPGAPTARAGADEEPRKRSGARARQAALREHAQQARPQAEAEAGAEAQALAGTTRPTRTEAPAGTGSAPRRPAREAAADRPARSGTAGRSAPRPKSGAPARDRADRPAAGRPRPDGPRKPRADQPDARPPRRPAPDAPPSTSHGADGAPGPDASSADGPRIQRLPRTPRQPRRAETFEVFAPCPHGLEEALALELQALGYEAVRAGRAGCHFQADWSGVLRANLYSRLATRILVQVAHAEVRDEDDILALARDTEWERWFGPDQSLRVDTSAVRSPMRSLQYCNLRAKDGICDRLREREGARPDIDTVRPDARVHLFLDEHHATLYLDVSGESLFKRGWRLDKGEAPLRENLAAGLLALSDWPPDAPLLDPFCGSGTLLIEAAWIALGVPPGIWRPFGFERLRAHDVRLWRDLKEDARARIAPRLEQPLVGCDIHPGAIEAARANAERAHLSPDTIRFEVCDARQMPPPAPAGWIVTNPPYGERLADEDGDLWPEWASWLKRHYGGWQLNVITSDLDLPSRMRLKARRRHPLHNGALDCRLFQFELVAAGYRDKA
ncbi:THUMP domain-containing protein [Castellaniella defragrans]|uniref:THUMP domain-containing protein n=1 Tax=Castellaniella defragrans TaxID=75697 RepID=UPI0023F39A3A|nr:THUMP domain-containing protein [Castellaniella defragrans]